MPGLYPYRKESALLSFFLTFVLFSCQDPKASDVSGLKENAKGYVEFPGSEFRPTWDTSDVLVVHQLSDPEDLHPTNGVSAQRTEINNYIHRFLLRWDLRDQRLRPDLLEELPEPSEDGRSYTLKIRNNISEGGVQLTAADVAFTLKANVCAYTDNPTSKSPLRNIEDILLYRDDSLKLSIVMKQPAFNDLYMLIDYPVIQKAVYDPQNILGKFSFKDLNEKGEINDKQLVSWARQFNDQALGHTPGKIKGLGVYSVAEWRPGESVTLSRKAGIPPSEAAFSRIIFKINRDAVSQVLEFRSQNLDISTYVSTKTLTELQKDTGFQSNYNSVFINTPNFYYLAFNMRPSPGKPAFFAEKNIRRALALMVPVDEIIRVLYQGRNQRITSPVSPFGPEYHTGLKPLEYSISEASRLLASAGWKDTDGDKVLDKNINGHKTDFSFGLCYLTSQPEWKDVALMVSESFSKAGIKANLNPVEYSVFIEKGQNHDFDMLLGMWTGSSIPEDYTQLWHTSSWKSGGSNFTGFGTPESDRLIDSIKFTRDPGKRISLVKKLQELLYDEQPYVFLYSGTKRCIVHKRLGNVTVYTERPYVLLNELRPAQGTKKELLAKGR
jgi:peptide/nickel transport system substrate-binding protein